MAVQIGCVVMAAGDARRFGDNKLAAVFDGKPLILRALEAVPAEAHQPHHPAGAGGVRALRRCAVPGV